MLGCFAQKHACLGNKGRKIREFDWRGNNEARETRKTSQEKTKDQMPAEKYWAVSNEIMPSCLTPAVLRETELGVQTDEEIKDIPVSIISFFS